MLQSDLAAVLNPYLVKPAEMDIILSVVAAVSYLVAAFAFLFFMASNNGDSLLIAAGVFATCGSVALAGASIIRHLKAMHLDLRPPPQTAPVAQTFRSSPATAATPLVSEQQWQCSACKEINPRHVRLCLNCHTPNQAPA